MISNIPSILIAISSSSVTLFLGALVYLHDRRSATNLIFSLHALIGSVWAIINYFSLDISPDALPWIRGVVALAVPHIFLLFVFVQNFPDSSLKISRNKLLGIIILVFLLMFIALSPFGFAGLKINRMAVIPILGMLMPVFGIILIFFFLLTIGLLLKKILTSTGSVRRQWLAVATGFIIAHSLLIFLVFLRVILYGDTTFVAYSPLFILPIFLGTAYAILKHNLFNVRVIATEIFTFLLLVASFIQVILAETTLVFYLSLGVTFLLLVLGILLIKSVLREVKQREKLEVLSKELAQANEELKKLDVAKSEFISLASHQLRAPLTVIKGYISLALEGTLGKLEDKTKNALRNVGVAANQLVKLVSDLLDLSRIESGKIRYEMVQNDFIPIVEEVVSEFKEMAAKKSLDFSFQNKAGEIMRFVFDKDKIREVVINLIDNAIKYSRERGRVLVKLEVLGNKIRYSVKDSGLGIKEGDKSKLFTKFSRSEEARLVDPGGMGIGLYFVKRVIEDHRGAVGVDSEGLGQGSTFWVELPLR